MERPFALKKCDICGEETHRRTMECIDVTAKGQAKFFIYVTSVTVNFHNTEQTQI